MPDATSSSFNASSSASARISIAPAVKDDIPTLAEINYQAYDRDHIMQVGFVNYPDVDNMRAFFFKRVEARFVIPRTVMYKATNTETGEIEGFIALTEELGGEEAGKDGKGGKDGGPVNATDEVLSKEREAEKAGSGTTEGVANENGADTGKDEEEKKDTIAWRDDVKPKGMRQEEWERLRRKTGTGSAFKNGLPTYIHAGMMKKVEEVIGPLMEGMKGHYYYISAFAVLPSRQGKGIGSALMRHCLQIIDSAAGAGGAAVPAKLIALAGSHDMCLKYGFKDEIYADVNLDEFDDRDRGYGVYRQWAMVRDPVTSSSVNVKSGL